MDQLTVPAWKRLGLKLKYARDAEPFVTSTNGLHESLSTNLDSARPSKAAGNGHNVSKPPSKKRRIDEKSTTPIVTVTNGLKRNSSFRDLSTSTRKTVSFTPETKEDDGESSNFMQDKWDEEARNDQINDFLAREAEVAEAAIKSRSKPTGEFTESAVHIKTSKKAKNKARIPASDPSTGSNNHKSVDALDYLQQYHNSRPTWKFNKNREVWLLKHALSTVDIPVTYENALFVYLAGIRSTNARVRLIDQCHDCVVDEVEIGTDESDRALMSKSLKLDTIDRRLKYYQAGRVRFENAYDAISSDEISQKDKAEAQIRSERVCRAAELLKYLLCPDGVDIVQTDKKPDHSTISSTSQSLKTDEPQVLPKKRKNRTAVVEVSSSSDESSTDSDESNTDSDD